MADLTVVTVVHGRHEHLARQAEALAAVAPDVPWVVVAMADPEVPSVVSQQAEIVALEADPQALPLARARNVGVATAAQQGARAVLLLDVDCLVDADTLTAYAQALDRRPEALLCGPVTYLPAGADPSPSALLQQRSPHPARPSPPDGQLVEAEDHRLFWSLAFAVSTWAWQRVGGFCEEYVGYGGEDTDFARSAAQLGVPLVWVGGAHAYHQHHPVSSPPVEHAADIVRNSHVYRRRWGAWPMEGWLRELDRLGVVRWQDGDLTLVDPLTPQGVSETPRPTPGSGHGPPS